MSATERSKVDWGRYAAQYDLLAENNPAYALILDHCIRRVRAWFPRQPAVIADFGAGTGNFSVALASACPEKTVWHVDNNAQMNAIAKVKAERAKVNNWRLLRADFSQLESESALPVLHGAVLVHSLYSTRDPHETLKGICNRLAPDGYLYICDIGRHLNVVNWFFYLVRNSLIRNGVIRTIKLIAATGDARRENQRVARAQKQGLYWMHELNDLRFAVESNSMEIVEVSSDMYRGWDDLVVARKPKK